MLLSSLGAKQRHLSLKILEQRDSWLLAGALPAGLGRRVGPGFSHFTCALARVCEFWLLSSLECWKAELWIMPGSRAWPGRAAACCLGRSTPPVFHTQLLLSNARLLPGFCHLFETSVSAAFQGWANLQQRPTTSSFVGLQIILGFLSSQDLCCFF